MGYRISYQHGNFTDTKTLPKDQHFDSSQDEETHTYQLLELIPFTNYAIKVEGILQGTL